MDSVLINKILSNIYGVQSDILLNTVLEFSVPISLLFTGIFAVFAIIMFFSNKPFSMVEQWVSKNNNNPFLKFLFNLLDCVFCFLVLFITSTALLVMVLDTEKVISNTEIKENVIFSNKMLNEHLDKEELIYLQKLIKSNKTQNNDLVSYSNLKDGLETIKNIKLYEGYKQ